MTNLNERLYVSTACLNDNRDLEKTIAEYYTAGVRNIEISALHNFYLLDDLFSIVNQYQEKGVQFIYHNYFPRPAEDIVLNPISQTQSERNKSNDLIRNAVELGLKTGVDLYAFHPGYLGDPDVGPGGMFLFHDQKKVPCDVGINSFLQDFMKFYNELNLENNEPQEMFLAIENLFPPPEGTNYSIFCTKEDIDAIMKSPVVQQTKLGLLIDLGHLALSASLLHFDRMEFLHSVVADYGDRIYEVHLSENDGINDLHENITEESWQLDILGLFRDTGSLMPSGKTRFCIESRKLSIDEIFQSYQLLKGRLEEVL